MQSTENRGCSEDGCERNHYGRGMCKRHYHRAWTDGDLEGKPRSLVRQGASLEERLRNIGWTITARGCWEWNGSLNPNGYGQVAVGRYDGKVSRPMLAHRVSFEVFTGRSLDGRMACHTCDNPPCVNPEHIYAGDALTNARDITGRKRSATGSFHGSSKLTEAQVSEIRRRYAEGGVSQATLAAEYGVSQQGVHVIVRYKRRKSPGHPAMR